MYSPKKNHPRFSKCLGRSVKKHTNEPLFLYLLFSNSEIPLVDKLRISSFNVVSILSGTGYVTDDFGLWGEFPLIFFLFLREII